MAHQDKLTEEKDEFVESLGLTPEKIREDLEKMRDIEGFPIGDVEDILELSIPPYYISYPNPYIKNFVNRYGTPYDEKTDNYDVEPFVENVSHGRTDSVYNIHFYHTKVPPQAIKSYIKHYTKKGDIILDFFSGTGMAGVAARRLGRTPITMDLSPFASFISFNNLNVIDLNKFKNYAYEIFDLVYSEYSYLYDIDGKGEKQRNFTVWSSVFNCPFCFKDFLYADGSMKNRNFECPHCKADIKATNLKYKLDSQGNPLFQPVEIHYINNNKREAILINEYEEKIIETLENMNIPYWYPQDKMMFKGKQWGDSWRKGVHSGITNVDQFFTKRNLLVLASFFDKIKNSNIEKEYKERLVYALTAAMFRLTILNRYMPSHNRHVGPLSGTLYVPKLFAEINPFKNIKEKIDAIIKADYDYENNPFFISVQSATELKNIEDNSIDYIFVDPPFGDNLMYSELNFIWESWIKVFSNTKQEAIVNSSQNKDQKDYYDLMLQSFYEAYRVLKPNRWITVEFHNSKAQIWRIIQESMFKAGFIVAQVLTLDKQKGTIKQLISPGAVKNDLIINAYKPLISFSDSFIEKAGFNMELEFVLMHLQKLPIESNIERTKQMIYSKLLAQYIQNGFEVRMDASEFYQLLKKQFEERDGFWFLHEQIPKYEKIKYKSKRTIDSNQTLLGISDEKSTINWLLIFLKTPKTYDEIYTQFTKNLLTSEDKMPELKTILEENFATEGGKYRLASEAERKLIEDMREKRLSKEFNEIFDEALNKRKIKDIRKEALLHGLMKLYKGKDVEKIKFLGERLDRNIIDSDDDISAIIDWAMYN